MRLYQLILASPGDGPLTITSRKDVLDVGAVIESGSMKWRIASVSVSPSDNAEEFALAAGLLLDIPHAVVWKITYLLEEV